VSQVDATFNGTYTVIDNPTKNTVTFAKVASNVASAVSTGTAYKNSDGDVEILFKSGWLA
jgi:hypothetical protein